MSLVVQQQLDEIIEPDPGREGPTPEESAAIGDLGAMLAAVAPGEIGAKINGEFSVARAPDGTWSIEYYGATHFGEGFIETEKIEGLSLDDVMGFLDLLVQRNCLESIQTYCERCGDWEYEGECWG